MREVAEQGSGLRQRETLTTESAMREALMMGLRLVEGIDLANWRDKFGVEIDAFAAPDKLKRLQDEGYIVQTPANLRATAEGLQRLNGLLGYLAA